MTGTLDASAHQAQAVSLSLSGRRYLHPQRLTFPFSSLGQPRAKAFREAFRRHAKADLDSSFSNGQRIVKFRRVCKISHAELIKPFQRASAALPADHHVHFKFLRIHLETITPRLRAPNRPNLPSRICWQPQSSGQILAPESCQCKLNGWLVDNVLLARVHTDAGQQWASRRTDLADTVLGKRRSIGAPRALSPVESKRLAKPRGNRAQTII